MKKIIKNLIHIRKYVKNNKVIKDISFLSNGSLLGSGSTFVIYIILARYFGAELFGKFSSVLSIVLTLSLLIKFGLEKSLLKHFGKEGWNAIRWLLPSFRLIVILFSIAFFVLILWVFWGPNDSLTKKLLLIMIFYIGGKVIIEFIGVKFQLEEKYNLLFIWQLMPNMLKLIIIAVVIISSKFFSFAFSIVNVAYIYSFIAVLFIIIGVHQFKQMLQGNFELKGHGNKIIDFTSSPSIGKVFFHTFYFGLGDIFFFIQLNINVILLNYIKGGGKQVIIIQH